MKKMGYEKEKSYRSIGIKINKTISKIFVILTAVFVLFLASCSHTKSAPEIHRTFFSAERMDSFFSLLEENDRGFGSISIFENGVEVYSNQIGYKNLSAGQHHDRNTEFRVGSISKTFLTVVIMQMINEGHLTLETKLNSFFPEVTNSENITIRQMLQHRSGIFNYTDDETFPEWMESAQSKESIFQRIAGYNSFFEPGTEENYSNSNFFLLALIAEKIDGSAYNMIIDRRIIKPLGLENTHVGDVVNPLRNEALPYIYVGEWFLINTFHPSVILGAGDIVSTPFDLNVFINNLFNGKLVPENLLAEMKTTVETFGLGLFPMPFYERLAFGHTGGMPGFQAITVYFPEEGISVSYTTNGIRFPQNNILIGVLSILFNDDYEMPVFEDALLLPVEILEKYTGVYGSPDLPLLITVFINENSRLMAQATGQGAFPLDAIDEFNFVFEAALIHMIFSPETGEMIMTQAGHAFNFILKEKN